MTAVTSKGHSKWQNIQHTKGKNDNAKGQLVNKYLQQIKILSRQGGPDVEKNPKLAELKRRYIQDSLPIDTFNKQLIRVASKPDLILTFELTGPGESVFMVDFEGEASGKIRKAMGKYLEKLPHFRPASNIDGLFQEKGVIIVSDKDKEDKPIALGQVEEAAIELDCEEVNLINEDNTTKYQVICSTKEYPKVANKLEETGYVVESSEAQKIAYMVVTLSPEEMKLVDEFYEQLQGDENILKIVDNISYD
ncbi:transcriptional regulator domain-containing protein [Ditylenchus destructor]|nr:transcriptional regulator domain-containing protein [Ditylenchus destructor]